MTDNRTQTIRDFVARQMADNRDAFVALVTKCRELPHKLPPGIGIAMDVYTKSDDEVIGTVDDLLTAFDQHIGLLGTEEGAR